MVRVLVTAGKAATGLQTTRFLKAKGHYVVGGARNATAVRDELLAAGYDEVVELDLASKDSILAAVKAAKPQRVLIVHGFAAQQNAQYTANVIAAVKEVGGVDFIARISGVSSAPDAQDFLGKAQWAADSLLKASGIKWAAVAPTSFLENFHGFALQYKSGTVYGASSSEDRLPHVSTIDIGKVAATLLDSPDKFESKVYPLTGGVKYSDADIVAALNKQLAKNVSFVTLSDEELKQKLATFGLPEGTISFVLTMEGFKRGRTELPIFPTVKEVTGEETISLDSWAKEVAAVYQ